MNPKILIRNETDGVVDAICEVNLGVRQLIGDSI